MAARPNPDGWKGGDESFRFVRTLEGHRGTNLKPEDVESKGHDFTSNARTFDEADLSGEYDY